MNEADIANGLLNVPHCDLTELEIDIALLNVFEWSTNQGGWDHFFSLPDGQHADRLIEAANRHSFQRLATWLNRLIAEYPALMNNDLSARQIAIAECNSDADKKYGDEAYELAEMAHEVWVKVVSENLQSLTHNLQQRT